MAAFLAYRHPRTFRATTHVTELSNEEMITRYRFTNEGVEVLEDVLREDLERETKRNKALTVRTMILITLRFLATGSFLFFFRLRKKNLFTMRKNKKPRACPIFPIYI